MLRRALFSLFLAVVACGMSFYVILFGSLMVIALTHQANPSTTPGLQTGLRHIVLPISIGIGVVVYLIAFVRMGKKKLSGDTFSERPKESNKAVV